MGDDETALESNLDYLCVNCRKFVDDERLMYCDDCIAMMEETGYVIPHQLEYMGEV